MPKLIYFVFFLVPYLFSSTATAEIVRHPFTGLDIPIASAVEVPANYELIYLSGAIAPVIDEEAPRNSVDAYGDTETQTMGVLSEIKATLNDLDLKLSDVIKMQVYLVADPNNDNRMDFKGFMKAYSKFFGTESQPNLPARSTFEVAGLALPGLLVEIEVVAARHSE